MSATRERGRDVPATGFREQAAGARTWRDDDPGRGRGERAGVCGSGVAVRVLSQIEPADAAVGRSGRRHKPPGTSFR